MSEENVEVVRAAVEGTMRRPNRPDDHERLFHPDHEFVPRDVGLVAQVYGGHRGTAKG